MCSRKTVCVTIGFLTSAAVVTILIIFFHFYDKKTHALEENDSDYDPVRITGDNLPSFIKENLRMHEPADIMSADDVTFFLYSRPDQTTPVQINGNSDLRGSGFNFGALIKIVCHGFLSSHTAGPAKYLRPAYHAARPSRGTVKADDVVNVIAVDWSKHAVAFIEKVDEGNVTAQEFYYSPARYTQSVGRSTADFIKSILKKYPSRISISNFHLIGHSLGAHAMGWAGKFFNQGVSSPAEQIPRITGLDPAAPCFETRLVPVPGWYNCFFGNYRPISLQDAAFVDIIHSHSRFYGFQRPLGHADFYPNGGVSQPGCGSVSFGICSHMRAIELMAASILNEDHYLAQNCLSYDYYKKDDCDCQVYASMGESCSTTTRGIYYLTTTGEYPFY